MKLIIGLGNPGKEYAHTRHNIGWDAVTRAAEKEDAVIFVTKQAFHAELAEARVEKEKMLLVHPLTFMNRSGEAVKALVDFYKIPLINVFIVQDEMDFPFGKIAVLKEGGAAGHNGVISIQEALGTQAVTRLRIGIGRPLPPQSGETYVLQPFSSEEASEMDALLNRAAEAIKAWAQV